MALAGRRFGCGTWGFPRGHLSLSWPHTRSVWQRSRAESEQSPGSFAGRAIIFILAGKGRVEASHAPRRR
jgi:hypothetical protein